MRTSKLFLLPAFVALSQLAGGVTIANWKELNATGGGPLTGANTDSPVYGNGSNGSATSSFIAGRFGTVGSPVSFTLAEGETLLVTGSLVLTGGTGANSDYRFGVFNDGGQFDANANAGWTAGWMHQSSTNIFQARTDGPFISSGGNAVNIGASGSTTGTLSKNSPTPLNFSMSITRDTATSVDIVSSFTGGGGNFNQVYTINGVATSNFTYTTFGGLFGGGSSVDQGAFSNVQANLIPEPSSLGLMGLAGLLAAVRRRR